MRKTTLKTCKENLSENCNANLFGYRIGSERNIFFGFKSYQELNISD